MLEGHKGVGKHLRIRFVVFFNILVHPFILQIVIYYYNFRRRLRDVATSWRRLPWSCLAIAGFFPRRGASCGNCARSILSPQGGSLHVFSQQISLDPFHHICLGNKTRAAYLFSRMWYAQLSRGGPLCPISFHCTAPGRLPIAKFAARAPAGWFCGAIPALTRRLSCC